MNTKANLHILRKIFHFIPACTFVLIYFFVQEKLFLINTVMKIFIFAFLIDYLRLKNEKINALFISLCGKVMRKEETNGSSGVPSYLAAVAIISAFFTEPVVLISISILSVCDPLASFIGIKLKDHPSNKKFKNGKSLFGFIACLISAFIICICWGIYFDWGLKFLIITALINSIVVATVELFPFNDINDNLLVPFSSALFLNAALFFL